MSRAIPCCIHTFRTSRKTLKFCSLFLFSSLLLSLIPEQIYTPYISKHSDFWRHGYAIQIKVILLFDLNVRHISTCFESFYLQKATTPLEGCRGFRQLYSGKRKRSSFLVKRKQTIDHCFKFPTINSYLLHTIHNRRTKKKISDQAAVLTDALSGESTE